MPTYQYECEPCKYAFEKYQSIKDDALTVCPECNKKTLQKVISGGSGYFLKDSGILPSEGPKQSVPKKSHVCNHGHHHH